MRGHRSLPRGYRSQRSGSSSGRGGGRGRAGPERSRLVGVRTVLQEHLSQTVQPLPGCNMNRGLPLSVLGIELGPAVH